MLPKSNQSILLKRGDSQSQMSIYRILRYNGYSNEDSMRLAKLLHTPSWDKLSPTEEECHK